MSEAAILAQAAERGRPLTDLWAVAEATRDGDPVVGALLEEAGGHLGAAVAHLVNVLNPERVVLGGNLAIVADAIRPGLETTLRQGALGPPLRGLRLAVSPLCADAVPMGGVALAMESFLGGLGQLDLAPDA